MVQTGQEQYSHIANLVIQYGKAEDINFTQSEFDLVISVFCFHWIKELAAIQETFARIARCLKPGGKFLAVCNIQDTPEHPIPVYKIGRSLVNSDKWGHYYSGHMPLGNDLTLSNYQDALASAGLAGTCKIQESIKLNFPEEQFKNSMGSLPIAQHIPEELKADFLEDLAQAFRENGLSNPDGTYKVGMDVCVISAQKPL